MSIQHPSFGELDDNRVIMFDTTLRDGEQSPGFSMNLEEKLRMAHALSALGVDVIEAGFPVASRDDFESVRSIAEQAVRIRRIGRDADEFARLQIQFGIFFIIEFADFICQTER